MSASPWKVRICHHVLTCDGFQPAVATLSLCHCVGSPACSLTHSSDGFIVRILHGQCCMCQTGCGAVASLSSLEDLDLQRCERVDCEALRRLSALVQLHCLKLSGCVYIQAEGLHHLAQSCPLLIRCGYHAA